MLRGGERNVGYWLGIRGMLFATDRADFRGPKVGWEKSQELLKVVVVSEAHAT